MQAGTQLQQGLEVQARYWFRRLCYSRLLFRFARVLQKRPEHTKPGYWDALLSGAGANCLGDSRSVIESNGVVVGLLRVFAPPLRRLLDVGCAGGTLAYDLPATTAYVGVDISAVAIDDALRRLEGRAAQRSAPTTFHQAGIVEYELQGGEFDAIVFSEVLYFLDPDTAANEVLRYSSSLSAGGIVVISMKEDPKSLSIFRLLQKRMRWMGGTLYQPKDAIEFCTRLDLKSPAFLVGVFGTRGLENQR